MQMVFQNIFIVKKNAVFRLKLQWILLAIDAEMNVNIINHQYE